MWAWRFLIFSCTFSCDVILGKNLMGAGVGNCSCAAAMTSYEE